MNTTTQNDMTQSPAAGAPGVAPALSPDQLREFHASIAAVRTRLPQIETLSASLKQLEDDTAGLRRQVTELRRGAAGRDAAAGPARPQGRVSDDCARHLAAQFIAHCERSGRLEALCSSPAQRDALTALARDTLNLSTRTALTTGDIPLPSVFGSEIRELISEFGVVRRQMFPYPIGLGTARPARAGLRPTFGSIAMSASFPEKSPALDFASLESHKIGGIVRLPRELDEQSAVNLGQFLARYGAVEFARAEDTFGFLADGSGTYESIRGIVKVARDSSRALALATGKTKPSDATLDDFRALRRMVGKPALNGRLSAYYLDTTWETRLAAFRTAAEPNVYQRLPNGAALLDGYPIVWTDVLQPYGTDAAADKPLAVFGALSFWWFAERGTPRMDTSEHVWFANDQLAVRFIEEIDFDYAASDATTALLTAAA